MNNINSPRSADRRSAVSFASAANIVLGLWLAISPWAIGFITAAVLWNNLIVGIALIAVAGMRYAVRDRVAVPGWVNVVLGGWLIIAPFIFSYTLVGATWNSIIVGALAVILAFASGSVNMTRRAGPPPTAS
jgi:hypothetical protein